jgi:hypothetical protein
MFEQNGVFSKHEPYRYIQHIDHWLSSDMLGMYEINSAQKTIKDITNRVSEFVDLFPSSMGCGDNWAAVGWGLGMVMLPMSVKHGYEWMIVLRNPEDSINSLSFYRKFTIECCTKKWLQYHMFLLKQIECLLIKPKILDFDVLTTGGYDDMLLEKFGTRKTRHTWNVKHNNIGVYENEKLGVMLDICNSIADVIKKVCK